MKSFSKNKKNYCLPIILLVLMYGCANRIPPAGGPEDPTTPEIISTYPDSNALYFNDSYLKFEFDRYVDELTLKESIFISPSVGELEFDWSGSEVLITFSGKLKPNTTYVVNIGTDVKDRFINGKQMAKAYSLAFSTGFVVDRGGIEGQVLPIKDGDALNGIMIFAYKLNQINPDTLSPKTSPPDYITQTGKSGDFFLHHIPFGDYRIFAIRDEYRNLIYDQEADEYAVPSSIIRIAAEDTLVAGVLMKLAKEDTTGPRLIKVTAPDRNHFMAEFSETLNPESIKISSFSISDTVKQEPLKLVTIYPSDKVLNSYIIVTQNQDSTKIYRMHVVSIKDSAGNFISSFANSLVAAGSPKYDTLGIRLSQISIKDSMQNASLQPTIALTFSDAAVSTDSLGWINLFDSDKQIIACKKKWLNDITVLISPERELASKTWHMLSANLRNVRDWAGRVCRDSTKTWRFETLDIEDLSSIEGIVIDSNKADTGGKIFVTAIQVEDKRANRYTATADISGKFVFPQVVEGKYFIHAFRDRNGNSEYGFGKPFPFEYSERMSKISDIFKVRARWPLEGVILKMK